MWANSRSSTSPSTRQGLVELLAEFDYDAGIVFHPDNALTRGIVERVPNAWALFWANPR